MDFEFLFKPVEELDSLITGLFDGAPLLVALGIAFLLGLRHASDPDHLVAVTSLVAAEDGDTRKAARLGAWWGIGHAGALVALGIPLIAFKTELPAWLESGAEKTIGVVILVLATRVSSSGRAATTGRRPTSTTTATAGGATCAGATRTGTSRCARPARRSRSACCTGWRGPARSWCC